MFGQERQRNSEGWIIAGGNFREIIIYSIRNATKKDIQLKGHTDSVTTMVVDGNLLITGSDDCTIKSFNLVDNYLSGEIGEHEDAIQDMTILKNGLLISCAYDGKIICWQYRDK